MYPTFLPDGRHFMYLADNAQRKYIGMSIGALSGYLLCAHQRKLMPQAFDTHRL